MIVLGSVSDVPSQMQTRVVKGVWQHHVPRTNAAVIMLDQPSSRTFAEVFASFLELPFPVALADAATIAGQGPFPGLHHVPSVVLLDRNGHEVWRSVGPCDARAIEDALTEFEGR